MKIAILSRGAQNYATRRLTEAARSAGHVAHALDPFGFDLQIGGVGKRIHYEGVPVEDYDVVVPRLSAATATYGGEVVRHFEWAGVPVVNRATPHRKRSQQVSHASHFSRARVARAAEFHGGFRRFPGPRRS